MLRLKPQPPTDDQIQANFSILKSPGLKAGFISETKATAPGDAAMEV